MDVVATSGTTADPRVSLASEPLPDQSCQLPQDTQHGLLLHWVRTTWAADNGSCMLGGVARGLENHSYGTSHASGSLASLLGFQ